jgi:hypothetical protein
LIDATTSIIAIIYAAFNIQTFVKNTVEIYTEIHQALLSHIYLLADFICILTIMHNLNPIKQILVYFKSNSFGAQAEFYHS